jgi:hypothetical protein
MKTICFSERSMVLLSKYSRRINLKDPRIRSLIISLGSRGLVLIGSLVFSYYLFRYALRYLDPTYEEKKRQK